MKAQRCAAYESAAKTLLNLPDIANSRKCKGPAILATAIRGSLALGFLASRSINENSRAKNISPGAVKFSPGLNLEIGGLVF